LLSLLLSLSSQVKLGWSVNIDRSLSLELDQHCHRFSLCSVKQEWLLLLTLPFAKPTELDIYNAQYPQPPSPEHPQLPPLFPDVEARGLPSIV
jgi:hypothetical protein